MALSKSQIIIYTILTSFKIFYYTMPAIDSLLQCSNLFLIITLNLYLLFLQADNKQQTHLMGSNIYLDQVQR